ncbi:minor capsid protein [Clostridium tetani]|uniref:minor capsid protein n=1 Tax=Clostridium tetani TaxID=1513 RepID=UPI001FB050E5|nr:minor capsid protein [Clostridium tetani]
MKSKDYWKKRSEQVARKQYKKVDKYINSMQLEYEIAKDSIQKDIESFYSRFAANNEITLDEARRLLNSNELREFKMSLEEFRKKAKNNPDGIWTQELNNVYYKTRVSRLEALKAQIQVKVNGLSTSQLEGTTELLSGIYEDTYYKNIFEVHKGLGIGVNFAKLDTSTIDKVIKEPWYGDNYSSRIWNNKDKLIMELQTNLTQAFIRGDPIDKTSRIIADRMNVSKNRARTLVNTESSYITSKATFDSYSKSGIVKEYEILATLDLHTSRICRSLDGKVFKVNEKEIGVNAPPFHPNCRTTIVPYFDDAIDEERIAKNSDGRVYYIPGNMNYEQWYDNYAGNNDIINKVNSTWNSFKIDNKQFVDKKEISRYLGNEYNIKFSDSRKHPIHKDLLQDSINWLDKFHNYFEGFKEINPVKLPTMKIKAGIDSVGYYRYYPNKPEAVELVLNGLYFTDKNSNIEYIESCIKSGWTVANARGHKTFVHEYGHHVADSLKWLDKKNGVSSTNWCKEFIEDTIKEYNKKYNEDISFKDIAQIVSRYGGTRPEEAFAETFAEYFGGEEPRKFAKVFGEKVEKKLKKYIKMGK